MTDASTRELINKNRRRRKPGKHAKNMKPVSTLPRKTRKDILNQRFPSGIRVDLSRHDYGNLILTIFGWLLYLSSALMIAYSVQSMIITEKIQQDTATNVISSVDKWPSANVKDAYDIAKAYNDDKVLANNMQATGDAVNPDTGERLEVEDKDYQKALNINGSGAMAVLRIPKISSEMTIYHGTTDDVLTAGVGHIYGTSLPIGQKGTTTAVSAHSGGVNGMFFTRLPQLTKGDYLYVNVLGQEQGYEVEETHVVSPDKLGAEFDKYTAKSKQDGETRIVASTCYPLGINTERWFLVAVQKEIPHPIPEASTQKDYSMLAALIATIVFITLVIIAIIVKMIRRHLRIKSELAALDEEELKNANNHANTDDNKTTITDAPPVHESGTKSQADAVNNNPH